jgi:hypothetical protein
MYRWGAGLAVTGPIRDIERNALQSSFETGSSSTPSYCHIFFLIAFLKLLPHFLPCRIPQGSIY